MGAISRLQKIVSRGGYEAQCSRQIDTIDGGLPLFARPPRAQGAVNASISASALHPGYVRAGGRNPHPEVDFRPPHRYKRNPAKCEAVRARLRDNRVPQITPARGPCVRQASRYVEAGADRAVS